jgi:hypothetical protein
MTARRRRSSTTNAGPAVNLVERAVGDNAVHDLLGRLAGATTNHFNNRTNPACSK